jgi:hypothetical protein
MAHLLERMARSSSAVGARLVVAHLPWFGGVPDPPPVELLEALPKGVVFVDLSAAVERHRRTPDAAPLVIEGDGHPNAAGHALIARELEERIGRHGLAGAPEARKGVEAPGDAAD